MKLNDRKSLPGITVRPGGEGGPGKRELLYIQLLM
jgi:hypothetical protein